MDPTYAKAWRKNALTIDVHSRAVILTRMPGKSFGNNVITIVCPKEAFRLSGVCYYVVVDHGAFEIADATPSALWFESPRLQQSLLTDRSQALWNRFTSCPNSTRRGLLLELQMVCKRRHTTAHKISLTKKEEGLQKRSSMLSIRVNDPQNSNRGDPLLSRIHLAFCTLQTAIMRVLLVIAIVNPMATTTDMGKKHQFAIFVAIKSKSIRCSKSTLIRIRMTHLITRLVTC